MVIANDMKPDARESLAEPSAGSETCEGTDKESGAYTSKGAPARTGRAVTIARVKDDFGERITVRIGEAIILGPLIDDVLEELRAKRANEG
jgi:hypothetical protein